MAFPSFLLVHIYQQDVYLWDHILPLWPPHDHLSHHFKYKLNSFQNGFLKNITYLDYVSPLVTFKRQEVVIYRDLSSDLDLDMHFIIFKLSEFDLLFAFLVVTCISLIINLLYVFRELCCHGMQLQRSALVPLLFDTLTFWHRNFTFKF
jgi:hypothetical protein